LGVTGQVQGTETKNIQKERQQKLFERRYRFDLIKE